MDDPTRRRLIRAVSTVGLAAAAGCLGGGGGGNDATTTTGGGGGDGNGGGNSGGNGGGNGGNGGGAGTTTESTPTGTPRPVPDVAFESVYDAENGELLIVLAGGDEFTASNTDTLAIRVDGERAKTWELPVEVSDQTSVEAPSGATVELVWTGPTGKTATVGSFEAA